MRGEIHAFNRRPFANCIRCSRPSPRPSPLAGRGGESVLLVIIFLLAAISPAFAQTFPTTRPAATLQATGDTLSVTNHQIVLHGQPLAYTATAGYMQMKDESGKPRANFFFVAYEKDPVARDTARRPITFVFNGGPGAAAVWLHLGAIGPKRLDLNQDGLPPAPPYTLTDNEQTWLDLTDLVFIDPVGTGYSRAINGQKPEDFYGYENDIHSVGEFIRLYLTRSQRWLSPKFLAGESYGTTRAAGLSFYLHKTLGIDVNGIILISSVLSFQAILPSEGNDLPYVLYLPSYTAAAWYHRKLPPDLQQAELPKVLDEAQRWALNDYTSILARGKSLSADDRGNAIQRLARYTGLDSGYIDLSDLRIDPGTFEAALLRSQRQLIGRFDSRIVGDNPNPLSNNASYDPALERYRGPYTATITDYIRRELNFNSDLPYEVLTGNVRPWELGQRGSGYLYVGDELRSAMLENPHLKVLVAAGYYDLATPFLSADYVVNHLGLGPDLRGNVTQVYYPGGHMMYHQRSNLVKLKADVDEFFQSALSHSLPRKP